MSELLDGHRDVIAFEAWCQLEQAAEVAARPAVPVSELTAALAGHLDHGDDREGWTLDEALERLNGFHEYARWRMKQAAAVQQLMDDGVEFPVPEELERPGWQTLWATPDSYEHKIAVQKDELVIAAEGLPSEPTRPEAVTVRPELPIVVRIDDHLDVRVEIGWRVPERVMVLFPTEVKPAGSEEN